MARILQASGGGITGLASAIALSKEAPDVQVDIYEATSNFSTVGAGIGMWPRIWEVMETLDLADAFMRHQVVTPGSTRQKHTFCGEYLINSTF